MKSIIHYTELYEHSGKDIETAKWAKGGLKESLPPWVKEHLNKECRDRVKLGVVDFDKQVDVKDDPDHLCIILECSTKSSQLGQAHS